MLYTASFENTAHHHGELYSVDHQSPEGFSGSSLAILAPSVKILSEWENSQKRDHDWREFKSQYIAELNTKDRRRQYSWLMKIALAADITLCTRGGDESHNYRYILSEALESMFPQYWMGQDKPQSPIEEKVAECQKLGINVRVTQVPTSIVGWYLYRIWQDSKPAVNKDFTLPGACAYLGQFIKPTALKWRQKLSK